MIWQQNQDLASSDQSYLKNDSASLVCLANSAEDMFPWVPFNVGLIKNLSQGAFQESRSAIRHYREFCLANNFEI